MRSDTFADHYSQARQFYMSQQPIEQKHIGDAIAILPSEEGASLLARDAAAKDFVSDAFAHCKYIGHNEEAKALFAEARIPAELE